MNIFDKRPLCIILSIMLGGLVFYANLNSTALKTALLISAAILCAVFFAVGAVYKRRLIAAKVCSIALLLSLVFANVYFDCWFKSYERYDGERVNIHGTVSELEVTSAYNVGVSVITDSIDGTSFSRYKIKAYLSADEASVLQVGTKCTFSAILCEFENYSDSFNSKSYYSSRGYNAFADEVSNIKVVEHASGGLSSRLAVFRAMITRRAIMTSNAKSGSLLGALLLGERDSLPGQLRLDFTRSGMSHALALSGMHLAILGAGVEKLLEFFRIGKRVRKALLAAFVLAYMALTGFPISVVRAGLMLILSCLLFLFTGSKDSLTNLLISVTVICAVTPYAVFSVSLWLSAFATFGIIVLNEFPRKYRAKKSILRRGGEWCALALLSSVFAIGATFFLTALYFDGISLTAILTNPILSVLIEAYLYFGPLVLLLGDIIPLGRLLIPLADLISSCLELTASQKWSYVSTNHTSVKILIICFSVAFFSFIILKIKHKKIYFSAVMLLFLAVYATAIFSNLKIGSTDTVVYSSDDYGDKLTVRSGGEVMLVDSSNYGSSSAYSAREHLTDSHVLYLEKYVVTHYSRRLPEAVCSLISSVSTKSVYLPYPENEDEKSIAEEVAYKLSDFRCTLKYYRNGYEVDVGCASFIRKYNTPYGESSPVTVYTLNSDGKAITYISSGAMTEKNAKAATEVIAKSNAVIFGCHGKSYKDIYYLSFTHQSIEKIVISGERIAFKVSSLKYYKARETGIYMHPKTEILYVE